MWSHGAFNRPFKCHSGWDPDCCLVSGSLRCPWHAEKYCSIAGSSSQLKLLVTAALSVHMNSVYHMSEATVNGFQQGFWYCRTQWDFFLLIYMHWMWEAHYTLIKMVFSVHTNHNLINLEMNARLIISRDLMHWISKTLVSNKGKKLLRLFQWCLASISGSYPQLINGPVQYNVLGVSSEKTYTIEYSYLSWCIYKFSINNT